MRILQALAALLGAATVLAFAAACGSPHQNGRGTGNSGTGTGSGSNGTTTTTTSSSTPTAAASLMIVVRPGPGAAPYRWTLTCDPAGGSLPHPAAACATLSQVANPFAPVPRGMMCPMIYSGPETATIEGTWHGMPVNAHFSKRNGCETARWFRLGEVLGPYATPAHSGGAPGTG